MPQLSNRNPQIDIIKGVGICLMVLGHCGSPITHFIYLFHMPIFFIVSGYVFNLSYSDSFDGIKKLFIKRLKGLWIPFAVFSVLYVLLWNIFVRAHIYDADFKTSQEIVKGIVKVCIFTCEGGQMSGAFWFLRTLFFTTIGYGIIEYILNLLQLKHKFYFHVLFAIGVFTVGYLMSIKQISLYGLDLVFVSYIFFAFGRILQKYPMTELQNKRAFVFIIASFSVLLVCNDAGMVDMSKRQYTSPWFYVVSSISGWFLMYSVSSMLLKSNILTAVFSYLGKKTISIIALHFLSFKIVTFIQILIYDLPIEKLSSYPYLEVKPYWWILYAIVGICIPITLNWCYDKLKQSINIQYE